MSLIKYDAKFCTVSHYSPVKVCMHTCCVDRQFYKRVILCNSLVWSCEITGQAGLTYQEAVQSELRTRNRLAAIPASLRKPLLLLARLTSRTDITDARNDIFPFVSQHFFVKEEVMSVVASGDRYNNERLRHTLTDLILSHH